MEGPELTLKTETVTATRDKSQKIVGSVSGSIQQCWGLWLPLLVSVCVNVTERLTKMALTRPISKAVGPRLKTSALRTNEMPRVPRSMALDSAPVWRLRWKLRSRLCKCRKTFLAMRRMELWATLPNTVFLSSLKRAAQARDTPSGISGGDGEFSTPAVKSREVQTAGLSATEWECIPILNTEDCYVALKWYEAAKQESDHYLSLLVRCNTVLGHLRRDRVETCHLL